MILFPNCKINLGLSVTARRPDGYHELESIFLPVPLCDVLEVIRTDASSSAFSVSGLAVEGDPSENTCFKAWQLLQKKYNLPPVHSHLHKIIPSGAGLGGGSADGAFMLRAIDDLFQLNLSDETLEEEAATIGSDCPFFIRNTPAFVTGRGEHILPIGLDLTGIYIVLINPGIHVATREAFQLIQPTPAAFDLRSLPQLPREQWASKVINDFEAPVSSRYPVIGDLLHQLRTSGAFYAAMSGSGSTVYGLFNQPITWVPSDYFTWQGYLLPEERN